MSSIMFGTVGAVLTASSQLKNLVCYVISSGAGKKGKITVRMIDDNLMEQMIKGHNDLRKEFYSEDDDEKRLRPERIVPILEKAGLIKVP